MKNYLAKISKSLFFSVLLLAFLAGCKNTPTASSPENPSEELKGNISISGAFALYPLTVSWAEEFERLHPSVNIDINAGGAGKGMVDVLSGMVDLAMFSREVSPQEEESGAWKIVVARDAVFPTINAENPVLPRLRKRGLTREEFQVLFTSKNTLKWSDFEGMTSDDQINIYTRSDACGAAAMWALYFDRQQEQLQGTGVFGDPGIAEAVKKDRYGVGFNNLIYVYNLKTDRVNEGMEIIPLDLNGDHIIDQGENFYGSMQSVMEAIQRGIYPSPPARNLYLIAKGEPENHLIKAFLEYILSEGQQIIPGAGYIQIEASLLNDQLQKLNKP